MKEAREWITFIGLMLLLVIVAYGTFRPAIVTLSDKTMDDIYGRESARAFMELSPSEKGKILKEMKLK